MKKLTVPQFKALLYADIFDYPLTEEEIKKYQVSSIKYQKKSNPNYNLQITNYQNYYFLNKRHKLIILRQQREGYSQKKYLMAKKTVNLLKIIPTIKLIAVTGALAMDNAKKDDDIDLLVITSENSLWTTRFLATILLDLVGVRRKPGEHNVKDKICLNMFLDEKHLRIPENERDIFSAHEAAQIKILFDRGEVEEKWWRENGWICKFLPKFLDTKDNKILRYEKTQKISLLNISISQYLNIFEILFKKIQLFYMQSKRTREVIEEGYLRFHPKDIRGWVLSEYKKRLRKYGLE